MSLLIRPERETDFDAIRELVGDAFAGQPHGEGGEADFVAGMRSHAGYIPELALVAEKGGLVTGYVLLTETSIETASGVPDGGKPVLLLAPLCVSPKRQSRGVGAALMREAFRRAEPLGYSAVFLAGNPNYYRRFGFHPTARFGIRHAMPVPDRYILAKELAPGALAGRTGTIVLTGHTTCASALYTPKKVVETTCC